MNAPFIIAVADDVIPFSLDTTKIPALIAAPEVSVPDGRHDRPAAKLEGFVGDAIARGVIIGDSRLGLAVDSDDELGGELADQAHWIKLRICDITCPAIYLSGIWSEIDFPIEMSCDTEDFAADMLNEVVDMANELIDELRKPAT